MTSINQSILNELKIDHEVPDHILQLLHNKFKFVESSLFSRLSTSYQQRMYFKDVFRKIVRFIRVCVCIRI